MLRLGLFENRTTFEPGETVRGALLWELSQRPEMIEVRLLWSTRGKGTENAEIIATVSFDRPAIADTQPFELQLPEAPYSFDGTLIALVWAVEAVVKPGDAYERIEIIVGPGRAEVKLPRIEQPTGKKFGFTVAR